jgi:hypothetical protein
MQDKYTELGFKPPAFIENPYGIKIYIGTKGKDDWTVVIPQWIIQREFGHNEYFKKCKCNKDVVLYLVTEEHALEMAERFTKIAQRYKGDD